MAGILGSAVVQEAISRVSSIIFSKNEEKASREHNIERLEMAHSELEFAMERSSKLPITDVSLLRRKKVLKRAFKECSDVLHKCKRQAQEGEEVEREPLLTHPSFPKRIAHATKSSIACLFARDKDRLCCSDVRRFERFANCAGKFLRDVESGCSLRHHIFSFPLLRQLLKGKTLRYKRVQGSQLRDLYMWPICLEERGVEAELSYHYEDYKMPEKSFHLRFTLRLSESTDMIGIAIKCLQHLASQFKLVVESATGELTLLVDLHDISHSYAPPRSGIQEWYSRLTQLCRPDPLCCKTNGHGASAKDIISSKLSNEFPEQVISISFQYYALAVECSFHGSTNEAGRNDPIDWSGPLFLKAVFVPHGMWTQHYNEKLCSSKEELRYGNIEQEIEVVRSKTIDCLILRPELADYTTLWQYGHGFAFFHVQKSKSEWPCRPKFTGYLRSMTRRVAKRSQ